MILADFLKMGIVILVMVNQLKAFISRFSILPLIIFATRIVSKSMKKTFEQVR